MKSNEQLRNEIQKLNSDIKFLKKPPRTLNVKSVINVLVMKRARLERQLEKRMFVEDYGR